MKTVPTPTVHLTPEAYAQFALMQQHDYKLKDLVLRLKIGGKECHGFTYQIGFTEKEADDLEFPVAPTETDAPLILHMDKFTAFYTPEVKIEYIMDLATGEEGFNITPLNADQFKGKFYQDTSTLPPWEGKSE